MLTLAHPDPGAALRARMTGFAGFLRANGFGVGGGDGLGVLEACGRSGVFDASALRWSLKAVLCGRGDEWRRFEALFDAYFLPPNRTAFTQPPPALPDEDRGEAGGGQRASRKASLAMRVAASWPAARRVSPRRTLARCTRPTTSARSRR